MTALLWQTIEDDHKRAEFMKWVDDNDLDITEERPRYMHVCACLQGLLLPVGVAPSRSWEVRCLTSVLVLSGVAAREA